MKGIILSTREIVALQQGRLTQLRRIVKPQPELWKGHWWWRHGGNEYYWSEDRTPAGKMQQRCPHGQPGDVVFVKEVWGAKWNEDTSSVSLLTEERAYKANGDTAYRDVWHSVLTMAEWASRYRLHIEAVSVQQVQQMTGFDAMAAGVLAFCMGCIAGECRHRQKPGEACPDFLYAQKHAYKQACGVKDSDCQWVLTIRKVEEEAGK